MTRLPHVRWWIAWLLTAASVLNYLDRAALGAAAATIRDELQLSATDYSQIVNAFLVAYTVSYAAGGWLVGRIGPRRSFALTVSWWSAANMAHALAGGKAGLMGCRFALGLGEASFYPAALRSIAEWFRPADRAKPVGMILAGASLGAVLAPIVVAWMMAQPGIGWRGAFLVTGALGFLLLPAWLLLAHAPRGHRLLTPGEREYHATAGAEESDERPATYPELLRNPRTWLLIGVRSSTDAAWYLLLFWLAQYFQKARGFSLADVALFMWIPYATADAGALAGGWVSSGLVSRGIVPARARQVLMTAMALLMPLSLVGYLVPREQSALALALCSIATFAHMAWGTNLLTLHSDLFPRTSIATVMGITGAAGSVGGVIAGLVVGPLVDSTRSFLPVFVATAVCHPAASVVLALGMARLGIGNAATAAGGEVRR